jgi:predicted DCC family thiol-disulfide oxidoreductase YuxK
MSKDEAQYPVVYFDGVCNLCNQAVQVIIKHDKHNKFRFASLQSQAGERLLSKLKDDKKSAPDSVILSYQGQVYVKSDAALQIARILGGGWNMLYATIIIPSLIRNAVYDWIARNRYKWFGKKDSCMIPTPELKARFLS